MNELLPCPFCGGNGTYEEIPSKLENGIYYQACCSNEDCTAYQFLGRASARKTDAAKLWNTRYDDWQPIETAPKDSNQRPMLFWGKHIHNGEVITERPCIGIMFEGRPIVSGFNGTFTHWKPLPQPPKDK